MGKVLLLMLLSMVFVLSSGCSKKQRSMDRGKSNLAQPPMAAEHREEERGPTVKEQPRRPDTTKLRNPKHWSGTTIGDKLWLRVSFDVSATEAVVSGIMYEIGIKGNEKRMCSWAPEGASSTIGAHGSFRYSDSSGNSIVGIIISSSYAHGTISKPFFDIQCPDGEYRSPPTKWRAAPR